MPFPKTRDELVAGGYKFENHSRCKGCGREIEWFTTPRGKKMPFILMLEGSSPAQTHFADCPDADLFQKAGVMIEPRQVIERARKLYSDIKRRSEPTYWKNGRNKGRVLWAGMPVPYSSDEFAAWLMEKVGCQAFLCPYCNAPLDVLSMTLDHSFPLKAGGSNDFSNLVPCCADCNNLKGKMSGADYLLFRKLMRQMHPAAEANILARLRAGALGQRLMMQQQAAAKGRQRKSSSVPDDDEPF